MSATRPSIPAVVTQPPFTCETCGRAMLPCTRRCYTCNAPTLAEQLRDLRARLAPEREPTPDELDDEGHAEMLAELERDECDDQGYRRWRNGR